MQVNVRKPARQIIALAALLVCSLLPIPRAFAATVYWNLFNIEGESSISAVFDTYATLADMLTDQNRTGSFTANGHAPFGANIVGTGAMIVPDVQASVPTPVPLALLLAGVGLVLLTRAAAPRGATDEPRVHAHA